MCFQLRFGVKIVQPRCDRSGAFVHLDDVSHNSVATMNIVFMHIGTAICSRI